MALFNDQEIEQEPYELGFMEWDKYINNLPYSGNPYIQHSNSWYSWNKGWNLNFNGIK